MATALNMSRSAVYYYFDQVKIKKRTIEKFLKAVSLEAGIADGLSHGGYFILGTLFFALMAWILYKVAMKKTA